MKRPEIFRVVLGPCAVHHFTHVRPRSKNGAKAKILTKNFWPHFWQKFGRNGLKNFWRPKSKIRLHKYLLNFFSNSCTKNNEKILIVADVIKR